jgi:hypothetical protein
VIAKPFVYFRELAVKLNPKSRHSKRETKRSEVSDLESRFDRNKRNWLNESGVPARAPQGLRLAGMTTWGWRRKFI